MKSQKQLVENPIVLGKIIGHFGVKGWLKVFSHTHPREEITKYKLIYVYLEGNYELIGDPEWNKTGKNILSSVGCYQVEKLGPQIIKSINGDFFNVLGFPLFPFLTFLSTR